jgi:uncharacterized protein
MLTMHRIEDIRIAADSIGEAGLEKDISIAPEIFAAALDNVEITVKESLHIHYIITRAGKTIHAKVHVEGRMETICATCLAPVAYHIKVGLDTDYLPAAPDMPDDLEAERQSPSLGYYRKDIPLGAYVLSETVLSLPIRYVCSPDCKGLCPQCGTNLNEKKCGCEQSVDPRLEKLAFIKKKLRRE